MPVGIQRINAKKSQPNERIVFIKPLKGPDEAIAQDYLERIAAQCLPIMKEHSLSVMTLEEYEPNAEFVGRNFNAGEIIQLVLKARFTGHWLPFNYVQMVMMHELAHCKQMNHSRAFWAVRNQYSEQVKALWGRGYTGDGIWGRGALLGSGEFERNTVTSDEALPEHLCGGTYRSRRRKRKAKKELTYQEKKERRILKKFGGNGVALGADNTAKAKLEKGRWVQAKPRVAGSARGRELRAAAALARFEQQSKEKEKEEVEDEDETASESETDSDYEADVEGGGPDAVDVNGQKLLDNKGHRMVKVCEDENPNDQDAQQELHELQSSFQKATRPEGGGPSSSRTADDHDEPRNAEQSGARVKLSGKPSVIDTQNEADPTRGASTQKLTFGPEPSTKHQSETLCPVCSFANGKPAITCEMCSNVLDPASVPNSWKCQAPSCNGSLFLNAGDCGVCGVCGQRRDDA